MNVKRVGANEIEAQKKKVIRIMRDAGLHTKASVAKASGVNQVSVSNFLNYRKPARSVEGRLLDGPKKICSVLGSDPEDVFPEIIDICYFDVQRHGRKFAFGRQPFEFHHYGPDEHCQIDEFLSELNRVLSTLDEREQLAIKDIVISGKTLNSVGKKIGLSRERIRQICAKALRKMRHPTRTTVLSDYSVLTQ